MTNDRDFVLERGRHASADTGACLMEAVSYVAGEPWGDHPACVCPVLAAYGRAVNDRMSDEDRQLLVPLIPRLIGTRGSHDLALRRMFHFVDSSVRRIVPRVLRDRGEVDLAERLESIPPIVDRASARAAEPLYRAVEDVSYDFAIAYVADATATAATADYAAAAYAATYAAAAATTREHTALVLDAFVEAIELQ